MSPDDKEILSRIFEMYPSINSFTVSYDPSDARIFEMKPLTPRYINDVHVNFYYNHKYFDRGVLSEDLKSFLIESNMKWEDIVNIYEMLSCLSPLTQSSLEFQGSIIR